jgi:hypothetical protein
MPARNTTRKAQAKPKATAPKKPTQADKLAEVITRDFGGKATFRDLAASKAVAKFVKGTGTDHYRAIQGIVTRDKGTLFTRPGRGEVAVKKVGRSK